MGPAFFLPLAKMKPLKHVNCWNADKTKLNKTHTQQSHFPEITTVDILGYVLPEFILHIHGCMCVCVYLLSYTQIYMYSAFLFYLPVEDSPLDCIV